MEFQKNRTRITEHMFIKLHLGSEVKQRFKSLQVKESYTRQYSYNTRIFDQTQQKMLHYTSMQREGDIGD